MVASDVSPGQPRINQIFIDAVQRVEVEQPPRSSVLAALPWGGRSRLETIIETLTIGLAIFLIVLIVVGTFLPNDCSRALLCRSPEYPPKLSTGSGVTAARRMLRDPSLTTSPHSQQPRRDG